MRAAEGFENRQVPSESQPQIASAAESNIRRIRSSSLSKAFFAFGSNVLSSDGCMMDYRCLGTPQEETALAAGSEIWENASGVNLTYH